VFLGRQGIVDFIGEEIPAALAKLYEAADVFVLFLEYQRQSVGLLTRMSAKAVCSEPYRKEQTSTPIPHRSQKTRNALKLMLTVRHAILGDTDSDYPEALGWEVPLVQKLVPSIIHYPRRLGKRNAEFLDPWRNGHSFRVAKHRDI
jgi:hypothetical protein